MPENPIPDPASAQPGLERLDEDECLRLISPGGIGRIAYTGQYDLTVLPVNYKVHDGAILFRTSEDSLTAEDLRTGIRRSEYRVAFEIDEFDLQTREGWSVLIQGPAHHLDSAGERVSALVRRGGAVACRRQRALHPHHSCPNHRPSNSSAGVTSEAPLQHRRRTGIARR